MSVDVLQSNDSGSRDPYETLLAEANELLTRVGISAKRISSIEELSRVSSSMFVAVYESLFRTRLEGINRNPQSKEQYTSNVQIVIDELSEQIQIDLKHILGEDIAAGDVRSISNLLHIFTRIFNVTSMDSSPEKAYQDDYPPDTIQSYCENGLLFMVGGDDNNSNNCVLSPPTTSSMLPQPPTKLPSHNYSHPLSTSSPPPPVTDISLLDEYSTVTSSIHEPSVTVFKDDDQITISSIDKSEELQKLLDIKTRQLHSDIKLDAAKKRREALYTQRSYEKLRMNRIKELHIHNIQQRRWIEDQERRERAEQIKNKSEDDVILRKLYAGLVKRMHTWELEEAQLVRERHVISKDDMDIRIQSLENMINHRKEILQEHQKARQIEENELKQNHKRMMTDVKKALQDKYEEFYHTQSKLHIQRRNQEFTKRRESYKDLLAILAASGWEDTLRGSYPPHIKHTFPYHTTTNTTKRSQSNLRQRSSSSGGTTKLTSGAPAGRLQKLSTSRRSTPARKV